jgi:hypothetical protein
MSIGSRASAGFRTCGKLYDASVHEDRESNEREDWASSEHRIPRGSGVERAPDSKKLTFNSVDGSLLHSLSVTAQQRVKGVRTGPKTSATWETEVPEAAQDEKKGDSRTFFCSLPLTPTALSHHAHLHHHHDTRTVYWPRDVRSRPCQLVPGRGQHGGLRSADVLGGERCYHWKDQ